MRTGLPSTGGDGLLLGSILAGRYGHVVHDLLYTGRIANQLERRLELLVVGYASVEPDGAVLILDADVVVLHLTAVAKHGGDFLRRRPVFSFSGRHIGRQQSGDRGDRQCLEHALHTPPPEETLVISRSPLAASKSSLSSVTARYPQPWAPQRWSDGARALGYPCN